MRLTYLHSHNFKSIGSMEIRDIYRALIFVGKNNTGKTSILDVMRSRPEISMRTVRPFGLTPAFP